MLNVRRSLVVAPAMFTEHINSLDRIISKNIINFMGILIKKCFFLDMEMALHLKTIHTAFDSGSGSDGGGYTVRPKISVSISLFMSSIQYYASTIKMKNNCDQVKT